MFGQILLATHYDAQEGIIEILGGINSRLQRSFSNGTFVFRLISGAQASAEREFLLYRADAGMLIIKTYVCNDRLAQVRASGGRSSQASPDDVHTYGKCNQSQMKFEN